MACGDDEPPPAPGVIVGMDIEIGGAVTLFGANAADILDSPSGVCGSGCDAHPTILFAAAGVVRGLDVDAECYRAVSISDPWPHPSPDCR